MTSTFRSLVVRSLLVMVFALGAVEGCGSSGSSTPSCMETCVKAAMCEADASTATANTICGASCAQGAAGSTGQGTTCTNQSARDSAYSACFSITDCTMFNECIAKVPACQTGAGGANGAAGTNGSAGTHGGAGTNGAAGSTGAGGAGAGATCASCDKAVTCCTTIGGGAQCSAVPSTATCNSAGANQASDIAICQGVLQGAAALCP